MAKSIIPFSPGDQIFAYLRDSGHEDQDLSIDQQETALRRWAAEHNLVVTRIFKDAARKGSSTVGRDELQNMMHAFRHGCPERGAIVWKYNRFARSVDNAQYYRAEIRSRGYIFFSMNDNVPEGPMGRLFEAAIDFKDEQYLIDLSIDVKRGLRDLVEKYGCIPGKIATGFKHEPVTIGVHRDGSAHIAHKRVPIDEFKPRILKAYEMRANHISLGTIQKETRLFDSINSWKTFFANPIYKGTLKFGDYVKDNFYEPMVSTELWDRVQVVQNGFVRGKNIRSDGTQNPRRSTSKFLLSGLARCAHCGSPLYGHSSKQKSGSTTESYLCTRAYRRRDCSKRRIPKDRLENAIIDAIKKDILKPANMLAVYEELKRGEVSLLAEQSKKRSELTAELSRLRKQITNLTDSLAELGVSKALTSRLKDLEMQEIDLLGQIAYIDATAAEPLPEIKADVFAYMATRSIEIFANADLETKRLMLRLIIEHVYVAREDGALRGMIHFYYPPDIPPKAMGGPALDDVRTAQYPSGPPRYRHSIYFLIKTR